MRRGLLIACAVIGWTATARAEVVERVVATVNDDAILLSELRKRSVPFLPALIQNTDEKTRLGELQKLYRQMLEQLIDDELLRQAAHRMQVSVTAVEVERAIDTVRQQNNLDEKEFWKLVAEQGFTQAGYRIDVRRQLLRLKVVNQRVRSRINITEEDVRRKYEELVRKANRQFRFRASHVFWPIESTTTATEALRLKKLAQSVYAALTPETFEEAVQRYGGGDLGWLRQGDLPEALEQTLLTLPTGTVSPPVRAANGIHLLLVHERERGAAGVPTFESQRDLIYRNLMETAMSKQEKVFLDELRRNAAIAKRL